jgi:hypothetical protein
VSKPGTGEPVGEFLTKGADGGAGGTGANKITLIIK